jgi:hypothetical protein
VPTLPTFAAPGAAFPAATNLSAGQTGNGQSTNVADRGGRSDRVALLTVTTAVGATPTCTYLVEVSADGVAWWPAPYADSATPETLSVATFTLTTAVTVQKIMRQHHPWRFLRLTYSANTNVTNQADLWVF